MQVFFALGRSVSIIQPTLYAKRVLLRYVSVNHCRLEVLMSEKFLDSPDVVPFFK